MTCDSSNDKCNRKVIAFGVLTTTTRRELVGRKWSIPERELLMTNVLEIRTKLPRNNFARSRSPGDEILWGAAAIAAFMLGDALARRKIYYLVSTNQLPVFRMGRIVCARPSTLVPWIERQERGPPDVADPACAYDPPRPAVVRAPAT